MSIEIEPIKAKVYFHITGSHADYLINDPRYVDNELLIDESELEVIVHLS